MSDDTTKLLNACVEYRAMVDKLEAENATLRTALKEIADAWDWNISNGWVRHRAQAALEKEAQP